MHHDANNNLNQAAEDDLSEIPAMALGALDTDDEAVALAQLRASNAARDEMRAIEELVGDLGNAVPQVQPPAALRERILSATAPQRVPVSIEDASSKRRSAIAWAGSLAAAVLILTLGGIAFSQWSTARDRGDRIDELQAQVSVQDDRIAQLELAAASAGAFVNFEQPLIWTQLSSTSESGVSPGFLARTPDGNTAYLVLTGVQVDAAHVFQAWLIEGEPVPVGTLRPSADGMGFLILQYQGEPVNDFSVIGVTVEPPGGSPLPTTDPIIVAEIV